MSSYGRPHTDHNRHRCYSATLFFRSQVSTALTVSGTTTLECSRVSDYWSGSQRYRSPWVPAPIAGNGGRPRISGTFFAADGPVVASLTLWPRAMTQSSLFPPPGRFRRPVCTCRGSGTALQRVTESSGGQKSAPN